MDYKTSLLIYRIQCQNVNDIWSSKSRLIKGVTPLFRLLNDDDFQRIDDFNIQYSILVNNIKNQITPLLQAKMCETDPLIKDQITEQISTLKLNYLNEHNRLRKQFKNDKILELESRTRILTLLYCTWSEATFKKLKHTPHGLPIAQRANSFGGSVGDQWTNLIDTVLSHIPVNGNQGDINQITAELKDIAQRFIIEPSKLRNKIAHGQWTEALNRDNDDLIIETSEIISALDLVKLDFGFDIHHYFAQILESILESNQPEEMIIKRHDSYLFLKHKLDQFIIQRESWNTKSRSTFLKQRSVDTRNLKIAHTLRKYNIDPTIIKESTGIEF